MNFIIAVDLEGLACVNGEPNKTLTDSKDYAFACRQAAREASAAANALFDAGADEVIVWDNHGGSLNIDAELLPERCLVCAGSGQSGGRWGMLNGPCDGALFIGYHSRDNVTEAVLGHTYSSKERQYLKIDGREYGEIGLDAMLLGEKGVPLLFVASDDKGCAEARELLPRIATVETKRALGWNMSVSKHPKAAEREIYEKVLEIGKSVGKLGKEAFALLDAPHDFEVEIRFKRQEGAQASVRAGARMLDAYTTVRSCKTLRDVVR